MNLNQSNALKQSLGTLAPYPLHSRIHLLKTFGNAQTVCFVKRDDELGFGISGSKIRKYLSLIPHLQQRSITETILIGGAYSNNVVGLTQLLIENDITPTLFLRGEEDTQKIGNLLLISIMVPKNSIHWVNHDQWPNVHEKAKSYAKEQPKHRMIIPEGANLPESLPGALTLALDILENEHKNNITFDHIFIDSGTGMLACATLLAFTWLKKPVNIHVVLMAEGETEFLETLAKLKINFETLVATELNMPDIISRLTLYHPDHGRSFGATNKAIFNEIHHIAQTEGFLTDPIYSVKLFMKARDITRHNDIKGTCLLIHSGGGLTLMGFQEQLSQLQTQP